LAATLDGEDLWNFSESSHLGSEAVNFALVGLLCGKNPAVDFRLFGEHLVRLGLQLMLQIRDLSQDLLTGPIEKIIALLLSLLGSGLDTREL
jgi:hypothetical protein